MIKNRLSCKYDDLSCKYDDKKPSFNCTYDGQKTALKIISSNCKYDGQKAATCITVNKQLLL